MATKKRLIDANKLEALVHNHRVTYLFKEDVIAAIAKQPTVNAVELVHGEWIGEADGYADGELVYDVWHCSECDYLIDDGTDDREALPNYCPHCGAKMDGGDSNGL